jgi:hypothetical protein
MMIQLGETSTLAPVQVANEAMTIKKLLSDLIYRPVFLGIVSKRLLIASYPSLL